MNDPYRRPNGRPQACEPCRRRKVSCDHTHPICRRCVKRKQQAECVYILQDSARRSPKQRSAASAARVVPATATSVPLSPPRSNEESPGSRRPEPREEPTPVATATGYVGSTNFCYFFKEAEQLLHEAQTSGSQSGDHGCGCTSASSGVYFEEIRDKCLAVLDMIPDLSQGVQTFRQHDCSADGMPHTVSLRIITSVCETLGGHLGADRNPHQLEAIARKLCHNTSKPLCDTEPDAERWISQFTGDNLRWESIGVLFTLWQLKVQPNPLSMVSPGSRLKNWGQLARESLTLILDLCTELSKGSFMCLYFSQKLTVAESMFSGDASLRTWRLHGDTVAMATFLGYHAITNVQPYVPTLTSELKRRLYGWLVNMDCSLSYFTGRPPLMSSQYSTTPLPLDLHDEELLDPALLPLAVTKLDENGWKRDATKTNSGSFIRARCMMGVLRESMATVAIGHCQPPSIDMLLDIKSRAIRTYEAFPRILKYRVSHLDDQTIDVRALFTQLLVRLEYLQLLLFSERLLLRHRAKEDRAELVAISFELVSATLPFWTHCDRLAAMTGDAEWLVMAFAAPAGGVLCHEILKPSVDLGSERTNATTSPMMSPYYRSSGSPITRASIIQKLSLLVGFLDWIRPSAPNADICREAKVVIQAVLDQALNNPGQQPGGSDAPLALAPEFSDWDFNTVLDFNCDLLDTFDWLRS